MSKKRKNKIKNQKKRARRELQKAKRGKNFYFTNLTKNVLQRYNIFQFIFSLLMEALQELKIRKDVKSFLISVVRGLIISCHVGLYKIASVLDSKAKPESSVRRLQRLLKDLKLTQTDQMKILLSLAGYKDKDYPMSLCIDRTNWKRKRKNLNILMIGIVKPGFCIPLIWKLLHKRGNSNTKDRIELFKKVLEVIPAKRIKMVFMDREFIGCKWLKFLNDNDIRYISRVRRNLVLQDAPVHMKLQDVANSLKSGQSLIPEEPVQVQNQKVFLGIKKLESNKNRKETKKEKKEASCIVISNFYSNKLLELYLERWNIERLFYYMKKHGFNIEDSHITDETRFNNLIFIISICCTICWRAGIRKFDKHTFLQFYKKKLFSVFKIGLALMKYSFIYFFKGSFDSLLL